MASKNPFSKITRRTVLKGAGALMGSTAIGGLSAPAVHAQEPKVLRYLGTAVNQSTEIAKKVKEDTGITIEYVPVTTDEVAKRIVTQPNSFDIVDE
ncbi:MAG: putative spermidine/putrescine transport system substrate-binding protein, partial [Hyphomicrobiales bacterium]